MKRRGIWIALALVAGFALLAGAWVAWTGYHVNRDLSAAVDDAAALRAAVEAGDDAGTQVAIADLTAHSRAAADRTDGIGWSALTLLPVVGDDARGVEVVSSVVSDLAEDGVQPLVQVSDSLGAIMPAGARIDITELKRLQGPVAEGRDAFVEAEDRLAAEDSSAYVERLRSSYRELAGQVEDAARILTSADTALGVLPTMLGQRDAQNYLLVFQNNAEIRATGGLPGAVSLVRADRGRIEMTRQVAAGSFGRAAQPVLPLTDAEDEVYSSILGTFFLNANLQPDFARAADLWRARWEQVHPETLDGVLSLDPVALSYILAATGPVEIDGLALTADNAVDELLHQVYLRFPLPAQQDAWFRQVARAVFDKVSQGAQNPEDLVKALARGVDERRIFVHDFDDDVQASLAGRLVAGELVTDSSADPQVGVYVNDGTGAKMSYFLRYDVTVDATYCTESGQGLTGRATFLSDAPENAASLPKYVTGGGVFGIKPGQQYVLVYLYGPVDGEVTQLLLNGDPVDGAPSVDDRGRSITSIGLLLKPGQKVDLEWQMRTGAGQDGDTVVTVTPSVEDGSKSSVVRSAC